MEITPKHQRNLYVLFIGLFAVNVGFAIWNVRQQDKLRKLQTKLTEEQLKSEVKKNGGSPTT